MDEQLWDKYYKLGFEAGQADALDYCVPLNNEEKDMKDINIMSVKEYNKNVGCFSGTKYHEYDLYNSLVDGPPTPAAPTPVTCKSVREFNMAKQQKEKAMNTYHSANIDVNLNASENNGNESKRSFLIDRLNEAFYAKDNELESKFFLNNMPDPKTPAEMRDRLAKGLFMIHETKDGNFANRWGCWENFSWRDPAHPADKEGYSAARLSLIKDKKTISEDIAILDPEKALASVRAFAAAPLPN